MDRPIATPVTSDLPGVDPTSGQVDAQARQGVNRLIDIIADGVEGHRKSAELVEDQVAQSLFQLWSRERAEFLAALQNIASGFGAAEDDPGSTAGTLHRAWMTAANAVTGDDESVIEAAANGEQAALDAYEEALETDLPDEARKVIQSQYEQVRDIHERLSNWEAV